MTHQTQLLGGCCQQQQGSSPLAKRLNKLVLSAWFIRMAFEVVSLINNKQIPGSLSHLFCPLSRLRQPIDAGQHQLVVFERIEIGLRGLDRPAAFLIEYTEPVVEATEQFNEPLID